MNKVGDRYKWPSTGLIHEILSVNNTGCEYKCVAPGNTNWIIGVSRSSPRNYWGGWEYLGNFSKENNFNQLYNLFNDDN